MPEISLEKLKAIRKVQYFIRTYETFSKRKCIISFLSRFVMTLSNRAAGFYVLEFSISRAGFVENFRREKSIRTQDRFILFRCASLAEPFYYYELKVTKPQQKSSSSINFWISFVTFEMKNESSKVL